MSEVLPIQLADSVKSVKWMSLVMGICSCLTIVGIPWGIAYIGSTPFLKKNPLPNRILLFFMAFITLPLCLLIVPIFFEIAIFKLLANIKRYEQLGKRAFLTDKRWQNKHVWQRYGLAISMFGSILLGLVMLLPVPNTSSRVVEVPFETQSIQASEIELGDSQVRQAGINGQGLDSMSQLKPLFSKIFGVDIYYSSKPLPRQISQAPTNQIIAQGTKRYQYMWCSDGSYRYYDSEQFKDPNIGFTNKSPDNCAQNKQGHKTAVADTAPPRSTTQTIYRPTYTPSYRTYGPTYTNCQSYSFNNSFSCTTY